MDSDPDTPDLPLKPFAVLRFFPTEADSREYMEVSLSSWLCGTLDDDMKGRTFWPKDDKNVMHLVKVEASHDPKTWKICAIQVMRFYDTFAAARAAVPKFIDDSQYDTESQTTKPRSRKRTQRFISDTDSEDDFPVRKVSKSIPPPPAVKAKTVGVPSKSRKGQGLNKEEMKKQDRAELMLKLQAAREAFIQKTKTRGNSSPVKARGKSSPVKSPIKSPADPMKSPWKVSTLDDATSNVENVEEHSITSSANDNCGSGWTTPEVTPMKSPPSGSNSSVLNQGTSEVVTIDCSPSIVRRSSVSHKGTPEEIPLKSPLTVISRINTRKSPTVKTFQDIPANTSVCLSPNSAASVTANLLKSSKSSSPFIKPKFPSRQLFSDNSIEERLKVIELGLSRLEILQRESASKLEIILMTMGRLKRKMIPGDGKISLPELMPKLPVENKEQLDKLEQFLSASDLNIAAVCDHLSNYIKTAVADPERKSAMAILAQLLSNNVAQLLNLEGGNKKMAFRHLKVYKVFQGTLQTAFPKSDLSTGDNALYKWLKDASKRKQLPEKPIASSSMKSKRSAASKKSQVGD